MIKVGFRARLVALGVGILASACSSKQGLRVQEESRDLKKDEIALAVATSEPLANQAAEAVFRKGGNIVDAAVAASFAISVIRPQSTGIGGGGFLVFKQGRQPAEVFDFREVAGRLASPDMYVREGKVRGDLSLNGPLAVGVPGLVAGLADFHQGRGKLSWFEVLQPAIHLAEKGVHVSKHMAVAIKARWAVIEKDPELKRILSKDGEPLNEGDLLVQKDLAQTLKRIAERGRQEFYRGATAKMIIHYMEANGGILTQRDLARYRVRKRDALQGPWRRYQLVTMPPPSSGGLHLLQILNMTDKLGLPKGMQATYSRDPELNKAILEIESFKRAFADRAIHLGDPDYHMVPTRQLLADSYLSSRATEIAKGKIMPGAEISPWKEEASKTKQTSHLSLMDSEGNVVSTTQTLNYLFGAAVVPPGTGIVLNDEMDDFSIQRGVANVYGLVGGEANEIRPRKRPISSMTPTIVASKSGDPVLAIGAPGGSRIITGVYSVLTKILRDGMSPEEALAACRYHHQWSPDKVTLESRCRTLKRELADYYTVDVNDSVFGEVQVVGRQSDGRLFAVADPRGHGVGNIYYRDLRVPKKK